MSVPIVISVNADFICEAVRLALSCLDKFCRYYARAAY